MTYRKLFSVRQTPQNQPMPSTNQVPNSAGGFAWAINDWMRLDRFLVLGSEGGTYYIDAHKLTRENAEAVLHCITVDGPRVVKRIVEISEAGRAPKNDPALFALAMCASLGDPTTCQAALAALPRVARIGTHLFHFLEYVEGFRGWGRGLRRAIADWYNALPAEKLAYQAVKYQQRDGWRHRDALRLAHPKAASEQHNAVYHWLTAGWPKVSTDEVGADEHPDAALRTIWAFEQAQRATNERQIVLLIERYNLPWEAIPTQWLASAQVWQTLLPHLPLTALLRNLARMTANGALMPLSQQAALVVQRITDGKLLQQARIHPIAVLSALHTYTQGKGARGSLKWEPVQEIVDALDRAFYLAFRSVEPTGKRLVLALDVSGSMGSGLIAGVPGLTPRAASVAMALVAAAVEKHYTVIAFQDKLVRINVSPRQRLDDVVHRVGQLPFGRTDCAQPMLWALANKVQADAFVIYTDSETWHGKIHPTQALQQYRHKMGIAAKLIVVAMTSNGFSIADPNDAGLLDVVGFDLATPQVMSDFIVAR
jgi:60 kDa SS-A/Ro ribonucleoprotein